MLLNMKIQFIIEHIHFDFSNGWILLHQLMWFLLCIDYVAPLLLLITLPQNPIHAFCYPVVIGLVFRWCRNEDTYQLDSLTAYVRCK